MLTYEPDTHETRDVSCVLTRRNRPSRIWTIHATNIRVLRDRTSINQKKYIVLFIKTCHITFAFDLILLKVGVLYTHDCEWTRAQIDCMLTAVGARDFL